LSQQPAEASWLPLRRFRIGTPEAELNLVVDDLDPYRDLHGLGSSDRLDDAAAQRWNVLAQEAWRHIVARHSHRIPELAGSPLVVIPLRPVEDGLEVNGTARESVGAIAMSPPVDALDLAQSLIHEIQHSKLGALLDLIDLYDTTDQQLHYSPWRLDSRPVGGLLQGVYAFSAVADFWSSYADSDDEQVASVALNHVAMLRRQLAEAVDILQSSGALTTIGDRFCDVLQTTNTKLDRVAVPRQVQGQVDTAFANHRATWQFDHLRIGSSRSSEHDPQ
jgi:HEXXH motif-containing protein